jgi:hypothetical protein
MRRSYGSIVSFVLACGFVLAGCPADDTSDDGAASTGHAHATESSGVHDSTASTGHAHATESSGADEHGTHDGIETSADDPAVAYCSCVFTNCHEPYHAKWGEDEMASEAACLMEAEALPVNGSDIEMGNFIECRMHFCELAAGDESLCANALGDAVCV